MDVLILGTRGSRLALRQTELVVESLRRVHPDVRVRLQTIQTTAERHPDQRLDQLPDIGFFVKELEVALLARTIDAAVHSMKDVPSAIPDGLTIAAVTEREDPRDVLVAREKVTLETLPPGASVGTSSPRRAGCLLARRPDLVVVPIRGNVDTRIRKVDAGELDAVCLAGAGLRRLGLETRISQWLPLDVALPAPGQGALGVEIRSDDPHAARIVAAANHEPTNAAVAAERALLERLEGGCRMPIGALASVDGDRLTLTAMIPAEDGRAVLRGARTGFVHDARAIGVALADDLRAQGAATFAAGREGGRS